MFTVKIKVPLWAIFGMITCLKTDVVGLNLFTFVIKLLFFFFFQKKKNCMNHSLANRNHVTEAKLQLNK